MRLFDFARTNSGALIIGASLIIGLNFERFKDYVAATPDAIRTAIYHLSGQADADQAKDRREFARLEKEEQARLERLRIEELAWQDFLAAARTKLPQIRVVKNSYGGDYVCLNIKWSEGEVSTYELRDNISDDFVRWLNDNRILDRRDWKYDDLQEFNHLTEPHLGCLSAVSMWRANRYQKRID